MDEIELKLHDMSSTLQPVDAYALVLEEVNGNRKLPVIIGSLEAKAIRIKMLNYKLPRPWTHDLFLSLTRELGVTLKKILIYRAFISQRQCHCIRGTRINLYLLSCVIEEKIRIVNYILYLIY